MGIFSSRHHAAEEPGVAPAIRHGGHHGRHHGHDAQPLTYGRRPTFGQWLKHTWLDILTMALLGAVGLGVYMAPPAANRSFAVTFNNNQNELVYPQFAYPLRGEIIPIWLAALLAFIVPFLFFLLMQIRVRSFWDMNNAVIGLLYSLITAAVFQVVIKCLVGGLRPHFLDVCRPDMSRLPPNGYGNIYWWRDICTGDPKAVNDALESFPSGHTTAAFAGFVYLYLYLNAKLKVFSDYHPAMWKLALIYAPLLGAVLIGGVLTIDAFHNWYDVVAGGLIGTVFAFSAYRMTYAAIWDWRFNHIPLSRVMSFPYAAGGAVGQAGDFRYDAVATRKAGWGQVGDSHLGHGAKGGLGMSEGVAPAGTAQHRKPVGSGPPRHADAIV